MRNLIFVGLFSTIILIIFIACSTNDEDIVVYKKNTLNGKWHLANYGGGFSGQFTQYKRGRVTWDFDTINNTVDIRSKQDYFGPLNGSYPYEFRPTAQNDTVLYLNDSVQGILYINDAELVFSSVLIATFKR